MTKRKFSAPSDQLTLSEFFESVYIQRPRVADGSERSLDRYRDSIRHLDRFYGEPVRLFDLSDELIQACMANLITEGLSPSTANLHGRAWGVMWRYAWRRRYVETQPRWIEYYRPLKRTPTAWSMPELDAILDAASKTTGLIGGVRASVFWVALILFAYNTGARISAIMRTPVANLDLERGWVLISAEHQKQRADQRFALFPETIAAIRGLRSAERGLDRIFGDWPVSSHNPLQLHYRRILEAAELPATSRDKFHRIRRTTITHVAAIAGEVTAQMVAGHSAIAVTRSYIDIRFLPSPSVAEILPRPKLPTRLDYRGGEQ